MDTEIPAASQRCSSAFQGFDHTASQEGRIVEWVDAKGYGWVRFGTKRIFVHISDFESGQRRPTTGEKIRFIRGIDANGRSCAKCVTFVNVGARIGIGIWLLLLILLGLPMLAWMVLPFPWWWGAGAMLVMSVITYGMYAADKRRAKSGEWRLSEKSLHLAELLCGWPGALIAQRRLRHKCSKFSYQFGFWCIVILFQIIAVDFILSQRLSRAAYDWIIESRQANPSLEGN